MSQKDNICWKIYCSLAISFAFLVIVIIVGPIWETNDDPAIAFLLSRQGNDYSPFQWRIFSIVLNKLYLYFPVIDWWAVSTILSIGISAFVFSFVSFRRYSLDQALFVCISLLCFLWIFAVYRLNFTRTAAAVAIAGSLLIADSAFDSVFTKKNYFEFVAGCLFMLVGASIRHKSAMIALAYLAIMGFISLITDNFRLNIMWIKQHARSVFMLVLAALVFFGAWGANRLLLTPEQKEYEAYNEVRSSIQDYSSRYPSYDEAQEAYESAGISKLEFDMFCNWFSEDTEVYTKDILQRVSSLGTITTKADIRTFLFENWMITATILLFIITISFGKTNNWFSSLFVILVTVFLCYAFLMTGRIPARVYHSLLLASSTAAMFISGRSVPNYYSGESIQKLSGNGLCKKILIGGLCVVISFCAVIVNKNYKKDQINNIHAYIESGVERNRDFLDRINEDSNNIYLFDVLYNPASVNAAFDFFEIRPEKYCANRFDLGGWDPRHPYYVKLLEENGIDNPTRALFERDDVYSTYSPRVLAYLQNNYDSNISVSGMHKFGDVELVQYMVPIKDSVLCCVADKSVLVNRFEYYGANSNNAWCISGEISAPLNDAGVLYCNISVGERRFTYRLLCDEKNFYGVFYGIDESFDPNSAQLQFFEKENDQYLAYSVG